MPTTSTQVIHSGEAVKFSEDDLLRFWRRVNKNGPIPDRFPELGPCWLWKRGGSKSGYGQMTIAKKKYVTHRLSFQICVGEIPEGQCVCHKCDVRKCVNPTHFFLGTRAMNNADMAAKGRSCAGPRHRSKLHPEGVIRGEKLYNAKLSEEKVREMRILFSSGEFRVVDLCRRYGVDKNTVKPALARATWKHVE